MTIGKITSNILLSHWKVVFGSHFLDTGLSYCTALCALIQKEAPQTQLLDSTPWQQTNHLQIYLFERKLETEGIVVMSYWGTDARIYLFLKLVCTKTSSKPHCCLHYVFKCIHGRMFNSQVLENQQSCDRALAQFPATTWPAEHIMQTKGIQHLTFSI